MGARAALASRSLGARGSSCGLRPRGWPRRSRSAPGRGDRERHKEVTPLAGPAGSVAPSAGGSGSLRGGRPLGCWGMGGALILFRFVQNSVWSRRLAEKSAPPAAAGPRRGCWGPGRVSRRWACGSGQGGPWPWQPLPGAAVNTRFQRGPCSLREPFSSSPLGLFSPGEEREGSGEGRACE